MCAYVRFEHYIKSGNGGIWFRRSSIKAKVGRVLGSSCQHSCINVTYGCRKPDGISGRIAGVWNATAIVYTTNQSNESVNASINQSIYALCVPLPITARASSPL